MKHVIKNKYGHLEFETVSDYQPVSQIQSKNLDPALFFSVEVAEQVALITGNRHIQMSVTFDFKRMYLMHHKSSSQAAVCKITHLDFNSKVNAMKEIDFAAKTMPFIYY